MALDPKTQAIVTRGEACFSKRQPLLSLWQDFAANFYPIRATFTTERSIGEEFADHLTTGYPIIVRQELADNIGGMLRPAGREWFSVGIEGMPSDDEPTELRKFLDRVGKVQREMMYKPAAQLARATKNGDNDYATFGNAVISVEYNYLEQELLYRCWHLRDCAWRENAMGVVNEMFRRCKYTVGYIMAKWPKTFDQNLRNKKDQWSTDVQVMHVVVPREQYDGPVVTNDSSNGMPIGRDVGFVSLWIDCENQHLMEATPRPYFGYVVARWQLTGESAYGWSPTTTASISDARMLQDMARTLLEAGEKAVDPPMVATEEAVRGDVAIYAGAVTYVSPDYDERLGSALRPISMDTSGIPIGLDMEQDTREMIATAWMLNKMTLPPAQQGMTAYEVGQRVQEYIRQAMPLFEPIETEYNAKLCAESFDVAMYHGGFGPPENWPEELRGRDIKYRFQNPFTDAEEQTQIAQFEQVHGLTRMQAEIDPDATADIETRGMFRDAVKATGSPADWLRSIKDADKQREAMAQSRQMAQAMQEAAMGGDAAKAVGEGMGAMANAGQAA